MSNIDEYHEVERVLDKRISRGSVQYKIQWKGFSKAHAKWVDANDCRCTILIKEYEAAQLRFLVGVEFRPQLAYGGMFKYDGIKIIPNQQVRELWPREAKSFLESRIEFVMPLLGSVQPQLAEIRPEEAIGKPSRAIGCTDVKGGISYVCEWPNGARKILSATAVAPEIVLPFLEASASIFDAKDVKAEDFRLTRQMMNAIQLLNVMDPVVRIVRNLNLDKMALQQPGHVVVRRHTNDIPLGFRGRPRDPVRGRKRTTEHVVIRAIQPNLDGRSLATQASRAPSTTPTPPNRTLKKNTVPKKSTTSTTLTYARPSRPLVRRLTFASSSPSSSPPPSPLSSPSQAS